MKLVPVLVIALALALIPAESQPVSTVSLEEELARLHMVLEAEREFLGPNYHIGEAFIVEGTIVAVGRGWLEIEQHLDSPPRPIEPVVNTHSHSVVQLRTVDENNNLLTAERHTVDSRLLAPGTDVVILYLPDKKLAKSIIIYHYK